MRLALVPVTVLVTALALPALAAGSGDSTPPKPTNTSKTCDDGMVWDEKTSACIKSSASLLTDDDRYFAARELAYEGRYVSAMMVLDSAENQNDPRILNYRGFTHRKMGDIDTAMTYYQAALKIDPDYNLARSYMGQGLIAQGDVVAALGQLREIEARGGRDTWAYAALDQALRGQPTDY